MMRKYRRLPSKHQVQDHPKNKFPIQYAPQCYALLAMRTRVEKKPTLIQQPLPELKGVVDTGPSPGLPIFSARLRMIHGSGIGHLVRASKINVVDLL